MQATAAATSTTTTATATATASAWLGDQWNQLDELTVESVHDPSLPPSQTDNPWALTLTEHEIRHAQLPALRDRQCDPCSAQGQESSQTGAASLVEYRPCGWRECNF